MAVVSIVDRGDVLQGGRVVVGQVVVGKCPAASDNVEICPTDQSAAFRLDDLVEVGVAHVEHYRYEACSGRHLNGGIDYGGHLVVLDPHQRLESRSPGTVGAADHQYGLGLNVGCRVEFHV